jgi:hypothetical protein
MIVLNGWQDYTRMFALATILGVVGGLAYELMQTRRRQTGMFELPRRVGGKGRIGYFDFGGFASMIVGAVAAVAAIWVFPPEVMVETAADGATTTTRHWDIVKLVGLSLIVGSAGASFLGALQARALAQVKTQEAAATQRVAKAQIDTIEAEVKGGADTGAVTSLAKAARKAIDSTSSGNPDEADF